MAEVPELHQLYRVDPGEFVAARAVLVKELRGAGRKDDARIVVKARKPTLPSWALDQVAHDRPKLIEAALDAGDALRAATTETLGGDASNLRSATDAEQRATAAVIEAAGSYAPTLGADHRERMAATLRAAILDDEVRAELVAGLLTADHEPALGFAAAGMPTEADAPSKPRGKGDAARRLAEPPAEPRPKRKVRRVGTPSSQRRAAPTDEVDARRRSNEVKRTQAEEADRKRAAEAERKRKRELERKQKQLDAAAQKARAKADDLAAKAEQAAQSAADAQALADAAASDADTAEAAAAAGPELD